MNCIRKICFRQKKFFISLTALFFSCFLKAQSLSGDPILIITNSTNPFSLYAAEILKAEGLNETDTAEISTITAGILTNYDVVVLGEMSVSPAQVTLLTNWVNTGGTLITFKPDELLNSLLGISAAIGSLSDKYILINTSSGPGAGIVNETIQFHGTANLHTLAGASSLATLYSDANTATVNPAVTAINVGVNGGKAVAFTYDLPKSIIYTRQGNPAWAGQKRDGQPGPIRSDDLFFGNAPGDPQPDWVDFSKIAIPQADEQQRFLVNIILQYNLHRKPLPRFWYLPRDLKAAIVMTGDDHANNGTAGRFDLYNHISDSIGFNTAQDVLNWKAIRATSYIYPNTPITNSEIVTYQNQGYEIALHPNTGCIDYTPASLEDDFVNQLGDLVAAFPDILPPVSNRTHCLAWSDWETQAKTEFNHGMRFDVNYYYWPAPWVQNRPGMFTGSGMPMRFADTDGTIIDCYQAATQMTDESGIGVGAFCDSLLIKAIGPEGYYGVFTANMHTDTADHTGSNEIIASALSKEIPVVSAKQMLTWIDGRNNSSFSDITWDANELHFTITAASGSTNLRAMVPMSSGTDTLIEIKRGTTAIPFTVSTIKGIQYAFFDAFVTESYTAHYDNPSNLSLCNGTNISLSSDISGATYQWQVDDGSGYANINDGGIYSGSATNILLLTNVPATMYDYKIRCLVNGNSFSRVYTLKFKSSWTGVADNVWENPANWSCGSLPDSNTDVIISGGKPNYPIINSNTSVRTLTSNTGANLTVNSGFTLTVVK